MNNFSWLLRLHDYCLGFILNEFNSDEVREYFYNNGRKTTIIRIWIMAKPTTLKIKLVSTADTGYFYVTKKNPRTFTEKMVKRKYDPVVRKHVEFKEAKIK